MVDIYRQKHGNRKRYTWRKNNPIKQARLDFFLVSESLLNSITSADIEPSYRSDHSMITLGLNFKIFIKGKGLWKLNNSLLTNLDFAKQIKHKINDVKKQYALPIYNFENIDDIPNEQIQFIIDDQIFLETLLMEIRGKCISFSSYLAKRNRINEKNLIDDIKVLEENTTNSELLIAKKAELEELRKQKIKGSIIRSKANWIENGEKPTKYFCNLEKRNFTTKIIPQIETDSGDIIIDQEKILSEIKTFYQNLYSENDGLQIDYDLKNLININDFDVTVLTKKESESLEGPLTYSEASQTLKNMKNDKSPGSDGFTAEFF